LPAQVFEFVQTCSNKGHDICIPETTKLEFDRKQVRCLEQKIGDLNRARDSLVEYGVKCDDFDGPELVKAPDLMALMCDAGVKCTLEFPAIEDFKVAHRKACFREPPASPDKTKSDEMRDLVIWETALRVAKAEDCAILVSRDKVHTHHRGDKEASSHGLIRCNSFERAYESLSIETASGAKVRDLVAQILPDLIDDDRVPLVEGAQLISVKGPRFVDSDKGLTTVRAETMFSVGNGSELTSAITLEYSGLSPFCVKFEDIHVGDTHIPDFCYEVAKPLFDISDIDERKRGLKELFGD